MALDGAKVHGRSECAGRALEDGPSKPGSFAFALAVREPFGRGLFKVETPGPPAIEALTRYAAWGAPSSRGQEAPPATAACSRCRTKLDFRAPRADRNRSGGWRHAPEACRGPMLRHRR